MTGAAVQQREIFWFTADGLRLFGRDYEPEHCNGWLPVICLHGLTRNSRDFEAVAPWIAGQGRRVFALDMRGRGRSAYDPISDRYNPGVYAQDVLAFMLENQIPRAIFVGTSMGGLITMVLSAMAPASVGGVVFNDVGPEVSASGIARIRGYVGKPADVSTWAQAADYARGVAGAVQPLHSDEYDLIARRLFHEKDGKLLLDYDPRIAEPILAADPDVAPPNLWPIYEGLAAIAPILVVRGEESDILTRGTVARMGEKALDFASVEVPGMAHAPTLEEPAAKAAVQAFLTRVP